MEEGDEVRVEVLGRVLAEPVAEGGARDVVLAGELTHRGGRVGVVEAFKDLGHPLVVPAEAVWAGAVGFATVAGSHGSRPVVSPGRVTVGLRAWLVQASVGVIRSWV